MSTSINREAAAAYAKGFAAGAHVNLSGGSNATTTSAAPRQLGAR